MAKLCEVLDTRDYLDLLVTCIVEVILHFLTVHNMFRYIIITNQSPGSLSRVKTNVQLISRH